MSYSHLIKKIKASSAKGFTSIQSGFTLIELLVVIGILGILAAAIVATLDPFEQLNRGQDTADKNLAVQFINANSRYYSNHNALPWFAVANGGANCYTGGATFSGITLSVLSSCLTTLISDGELKSSFSSAPGLTDITATNPNPQTSGTADIIACFKPKSKAQQKDANTKYTASGATGTGCKSTGGATDCYWCAQ